MFPFYKKQIRFAALSLDGKGASSWGNCALILKDDLIRDRATVFEQNSVYFCREHFDDLGKGLPQGYRATWENRHRLAVAKLGSRLNASTENSQFPVILISPGPSKHAEEFIEVHIYGSLHRHSVEDMAVSGPLRRADRLIFDNLRRKLVKGR